MVAFQSQEGLDVSKISKYGLLDLPEVVIAEPFDCSTSRVISLLKAHLVLLDCRKFMRQDTISRAWQIVLVLSIRHASSGLSKTSEHIQRSQP